MRMLATLPVIGMLPALKSEDLNPYDPLLKELQRRTADTEVKLRDDLADVIYNITPTETPFISTKMMNDNIREVMGQIDEAQHGRSIRNE